MLRIGDIRVTSREVKGDGEKGLSLEAMLLGGDVLN